jgi:clan AA aspartic protease
MIAGSVNSYREAVIRIRIQDQYGAVHELEAIIDTGFSGVLTLPSSVVASLGLPFRRRGRATLADGNTSVFDIHEAVIFWDGIPLRVAVDVADVDPLVGMKLLEGYKLTVQVVDGGSVEITALTP